MILFKPDLFLTRYTVAEIESVLEIRNPKEGWLTTNIGTFLILKTGGGFYDIYGWQGNRLPELRSNICDLKAYFDRKENHEPERDSGKVQC